jgi:hypothetical protein
MRTWFEIIRTRLGDPNPETRAVEGTLDECQEWYERFVTLYGKDNVTVKHEEGGHVAV